MQFYAADKIKCILEEEAPLSSFFIDQTEHMIGLGNYLYFDEKGDVFQTLTSDQKLYNACIRFLIDHGVPVFTDTVSMNHYIANWKLGVLEA